MTGEQKKIGELKFVELKEIWEHEARDFTTWLSENLDVLNKQLPKDIDMDLELVETEKPIGPFAADIVGRTQSSGGRVVIENQLGKSDHGHLGKLLTYAVNTDANTVLWITPDPRPEHLRVMNFLTDATDIEFHMIKVQAFSIDGSKPAPLFSVVSGSDEITKKFADDKKKHTEKNKLQHKFWTQLLEKSNEVNKIFANVTAGYSGWQSATAGKPLTKYEYNLMAKQTRVRLVVKADSFTDEALTAKNKRYKKLLDKRDEIEKAFGHKLVWEVKEKNKGSHIDYVLKKGGLYDEDKWPAIMEAMVTAMDKFATVLKPYIRKL